MRKIKFRGFGIFEWVYGSLVGDGDKLYSVEEVETSNEYGDGTDLYATVWSEVSLKSVGEFTGLTDKNGKEIYEGDIVKTHNQNNVIKYEYGSFMLVGLHKDKYKRNYSRLYDYLIDSTISNMTGSRFDGVTTTLEVIGNIYSNPELIQS